MLTLKYLSSRTGITITRLIRGTTTVACLLGVAGAAHAATWQAAPATCVPVSQADFASTVTGVPGAFISPIPALGGVTIRYYCNVLNPLDAVPMPPWALLRLHYAMTPGSGSVTAQLYSKNKTTLLTALVATASSVGGPSPSAVPLPLLNFATNAYHVLVTVTGAAAPTPQAHMVEMF